MKYKKPKIKKFYKNGSFEDAGDLVFTVLTLLFLFFIMTLLISSGKAKSEKLVEKQGSEWRARYLVNEYLKSPTEYQGMNITNADLILLNWKTASETIRSMKLSENIQKSITAFFEQNDEEIIDIGWVYIDDEFHTKRAITITTKKQKIIIEKNLEVKVNDL